VERPIGSQTIEPSKTILMGQQPLTQLATLALGAAAEMARAGKHSAALDLLSTLAVEQTSSPEALDLLARIHAQQGSYDKAEVLWMRAAEERPSNQGYQLALHRLRRIAESPFQRLLAAPWFATLLIIVVVVLFLGLTSLVAVFGLHSAAPFGHTPTH
jgi:Flp pilus assembly protein TadB